MVQFVCMLGIFHDFFCRLQIFFQHCPPPPPPPPPNILSGITPESQTAWIQTVCNSIHLQTTKLTASMCVYQSLLITILGVFKERRLGQDCANAHARLNPRWPHRCD